MNYSLYYGNWHIDSLDHFENMAKWQIELLNPYIPSDKTAKVLDIGCGYGFSLYAMEKLGFRDLTGIEISAEQAAVASKYFNNIILSNDTIDTLNGLKVKYDFVILFDVLEHIPVDKQISFIQSIFNVMSNDSSLIITTPNANSILSSRWRYNDFTHFSSFTEHSLKFILENARFNIVELESKKGLTNFPKAFWRKGYKSSLRKWLIRYFWLQVFKAEQSNEDISAISFELNLLAVAKKRL